MATLKKQTSDRTGVALTSSPGISCQPFSVAGKRQGTADERHLWPDMLRAIREIRPQWIVGENVRGIISWNGGVVFEQVQAELETEGYQVQPYVLPAAGLGAPQRRERVWFIAYSGRNGYGGNGYPEDRREKGKAKSNEDERQRFRHEPGRDGATHASSTPIVSDATVGAIIGKNDRFKPTKGLPRKINQNGKSGSVGLARLMQLLPTPLASELERDASEGLPKGHRGQPGPETVEPAGNYRIPGWENFPQTEPTICRGNDGIPGKLDYKSDFTRDIR
ncbi:DNA cytosine methyltransferase [Pedobacter sp. P26]|uniref:DNA cytosine methyltransferase n=1 Tax=Pedobacter sp. P26 TaxID=3423956 RepID=UPI003D666ECE